MADTKEKAKAKSQKAKVQAEATFSKDTYMTWYEQMKLMRRFEEKAGQLYGMGLIGGFCHL